MMQGHILEQYDVLQPHGKYPYMVYLALIAD